MKTLREQIEACRTLRDNWNSYGAPALTGQLIDTALVIADQIEPLGLFTMACPTNDGGMELSNNDTSIWVKILVDDEETGTVAER